MSLTSNEWFILAIMLAVLSGVAASAARIQFAKRKASKQAEARRDAFKPAPHRPDTEGEASDQSADEE